jgi:hypothetical protein
MASTGDPGRPPRQGRFRGNRTLLAFAGIVVLILVVIFGYLLLVGGNG